MAYNEGGRILECMVPGQCPVCGRRDDDRAAGKVTNHYNYVIHHADDNHRWFIVRPNQPANNPPACGAGKCGAQLWMVGCTLAAGHGGPHYDPMRMWWEERADPPDWTPPRYTVLVDLRGPNGHVLSSVVVAADQETTVDLTNHFGLVLAFKVRQIPEGA